MKGREARRRTGERGEGRDGVRDGSKLLSRGCPSPPSLVPPGPGCCAKVSEKGPGPARGGPALAAPHPPTELGRGRGHRAVGRGGGRAQAPLALTWNILITSSQLRCWAKSQSLAVMSMRRQMSMSTFMAFSWIFVSRSDRFCAGSMGSGEGGPQGPATSPHPPRHWVPLQHSAQDSWLPGQTGPPKGVAQWLGPAGGSLLELRRLQERLTDYQEL